MNSEDLQDQLIDMLLRESVGGETPPDVRSSVMKAAEESFPKLAIHRHGPRPSPSQVVSIPSASRSPVYVIAALIAVLIVAMTLVHFRGIEKERTPVLTVISGSADHSTGALHEGDQVSTGAESSAVLTYPDGTVVRLEADTTIQIPARSWGDRSKGVDLIKGMISAEVEPQASGYPMILSAEFANAEVVGTKLSFQHDGELTRLEVTEGAVHFTPSKGGEGLLVKSGIFAEASETELRSGPITVPLRRGIIRFTLMNADTDQPLRESALINGEVISLSTLPTANINIRADYEGEAPATVRIRVRRYDGQPTGMRSAAADDQSHPPFFAAGDHWPDGRPNDCHAWTPQPGRYHIYAEAVYDDGRENGHGSPLEMDFQITS